MAINRNIEFLIKNTCKNKTKDRIGSVCNPIAAQLKIVSISSIKYQIWPHVDISLSIAILLD